jgi:CTP:molybdopterin cytidylyltransferase MocA
LSRVYLLAAGRGKRAGGPKAWLEHQGRPLLERQVHFLRSLFPGDRIAVSIQADWLGQCLALDPRVRWVGVDPDLSPLASLQALWRALPLESWGLVYHVDMPVWEPALFRALQEAAESSEKDAVVPSLQGKRGHPVALAPRAAEALLALDPAVDRLDQWLRAHQVEELEVSSPSAVENWNSPGI